MNDLWTFDFSLTECANICKASEIVIILLQLHSTQFRIMLPVKKLNKSLRCLKGGLARNFQYFNVDLMNKSGQPYRMNEKNLLAAW